MHPSIGLPVPVRRNTGMCSRLIKAISPARQKPARPRSSPRGRVPSHWWIASGVSIKPNIVGHWKLDETSGTTATDSSGAGNDGTLNNMDPATDWVYGEIGGGLDFDGVGRLRRRRFG